MANPEAFLDILTIRSLKKRYHYDSESDPSSVTLLSNNDDLESFVRDFAIDDSISDCFAEDWNVSTDDPQTLLKFDTDVASQHPAVSTDPVFHRRFTQAVSVEVKHKGGTPEKQKESHHQPSKLISDKHLYDANGPTKKQNVTVSHKQDVLAPCHLGALNEKLETIHSSFVPPFPESTEVKSKIDKEPKLSSKHSKFVLKQVWQNTLKKCIAKRNSPLVDDSYALSSKSEQFSTSEDHLPCCLKTEDFNNLFVAKLNKQYQAKSESDLTSHTGDKSFGSNGGDGLIASKSVESICFTNPDEGYNIAEKSDSRYHSKYTPSCSEKTIRIFSDETLTPPRNMLKHCLMPKVSVINSSLLVDLSNVKKVDGSIESNRPQPGQGPLTNGKYKDADSGITSDIKMVLLDQINEALFQRILVSLLKQTRCSHLLTDVLRIFTSGMLAETLGTALDQLKQLCFYTDVPQEVCRAVETIQKNLQHMGHHLNLLKETVETLKAEMPFFSVPTDLGSREDIPQPRTLMVDAYNIAQKQPPNLNDKIQDLISSHLKSRLHALTSNQASSVDHIFQEKLNIQGMPQSKFTQNPCDPYTVEVKNHNVWSKGQAEVTGNQQSPNSSGNVEVLKQNLVVEHGPCKVGKAHDSRHCQSCRHGRKNQDRRLEHGKPRHPDARRCRRKSRRSSSDSRYSRWHHHQGSPSAGQTLSITRSSSHSADRRSRSKRRSRSFTRRSSSSSKSSWLPGQLQPDEDEYFTDNESDGEEDDDDDDGYKQRVRLNLDNEDLPDETLRIDRLNRHLESVQRLHQSSNDVIETIITGTGETLMPDSAYSKAQHSDPSDICPVVGRQEETSCLMRPELQKSSKLGVFNLKKLASTHKFGHDKVLVGNTRELTDSEFEEMFDRSNDITIKRRQQMDSEIPWDQLSFSESDSDEHETVPQL